MVIAIFAIKVKQCVIVKDKAGKKIGLKVNAKNVIKTFSFVVVDLDKIN